MLKALFWKVVSEVKAEVQRLQKEKEEYLKIKAPIVTNHNPSVMSF